MVGLDFGGDLPAIRNLRTDPEAPTWFASAIFLVNLAVVLYMGYLRAQDRLKVRESISSFHGERGLAPFRLRRPPEVHVLPEPV